MRFASLIVSALAGIVCCASARAADTAKLLNVSYDPTREFYAEYNAQFSAQWKDKDGRNIMVKQSHGGSGKQARSVIDGLGADVVTLALAYDIDAIAEKTQLLPADWQSKLPDNSSPYTSTIVFLVRAGNPKGIKDWADLVQPGVQVITPNPKTSGGARWNYLAAYGWALKANKNDETKAQEYLKALFANVPVLDTGARGATVTFAQRNIGDVLLAWENEAILAKQESGDKGLEIVYPSLSILAEPPVAVVEKNAEKHDTLDIARAYLHHLYSPEAQALIAKHHFRPRDEKVLAAHAAEFPALPMLTIADFGGWKKAQEVHFDDSGVFDQITGAAK